MIDPWGKDVPVPDFVVVELKEHAVRLAVAEANAAAAEAERDAARAERDAAAAETRLAETKTLAAEIRLAVAEVERDRLRTALQWIAAGPTKLAPDEIARRALAPPAAAEQGKTSDSCCPQCRSDDWLEVDPPVCRCCGYQVAGERTP